MNGFIKIYIKRIRHFQFFQRLIAVNVVLKTPAINGKFGFPLLDVPSHSCCEDKFSQYNFRWECYCASYDFRYYSFCHDMDFVKAGYIFYIIKEVSDYVSWGNNTIASTELWYRRKIVFVGLITILPYSQLCCSLFDDRN